MLDQAENFINSISNHDTLFWKTLLGASCNYGDVERAQRAATEILKYEPKDASTYILLANAYATAKRWTEHSTVWTEMVNNGIQKIPGITWVTINKKTETFYVDSDHLYLYLSI